MNVLKREDLFRSLGPWVLVNEFVSGLRRVFGFISAALECDDPYKWLLLR